jgi:hypothetical protein
VQFAQLDIAWSALWRALSPPAPLKAAYIRRGLRALSTAVRPGPLRWRWHRSEPPAAIGWQRPTSQWTRRLQQRLALDEGQGWRCRGRRDAGDRKRNRRAEPRVNRRSRPGSAKSSASHHRQRRTIRRRDTRFSPSPSRALQLRSDICRSSRVRPRQQLHRTRSMRADIRKPSSFISWSIAVPRKRSTSWQSWGGIQRGSSEASFGGLSFMSTRQTRRQLIGALLPHNRPKGRPKRRRSTSGA